MSPALLMLESNMEKFKWLNKEKLFFRIFNSNILQDSRKF